MNIELRTNVNDLEYRLLQKFMKSLELNYTIHDVKGSMIKEVWD